MAAGKALNGKPYAGNPHVRFDEEEVASAATPRRGSLLYSITECFRRGGVETRNYASAFALAAVLTAAALAPFAASAGSATLKCSGYTGTETLTDFQALIKLDEGRYGFSYEICILPI